MNKAIAIFNFPDSCNECELCVSEYSFWGDVSKSKCLVLGQDNIGALIKECRMNCCPLKPIPQRKITDLEKTTDYSCGWEQGYNACIYEILGEEE